MLIPDWDMKHGASSRDEKPLMEVGDEEVGIEGGHVDGHMSNPVGAIDEGQDAFLFADLGELFERHSEAR